MTLYLLIVIVTEVNYMADTSFYQQIWTVSADIKHIGRYTERDNVADSVTADYLLPILGRYNNFPLTSMYPFPMHWSGGLAGCLGTGTFWG